eukprot:CAMPEP_0171668978 /NCGR_PEP_ID=MMETSP0990-20121206/49694_1 /TAXON_ID=483369 /ORGANISM="non described non described, Strain CCMP2098" /LENGTH=49 /DNA_ID=CAMNT_0012253137 /DNA_START=534 /DNA_END=683 /DNA_ORIENTATION=+
MTKLMTSSETPSSETPPRRHELREREVDRLNPRLNPALAAPRSTGLLSR